MVRPRQGTHRPRLTVSATQYRTLAFAALVLLGTIVVTGAGVRLSESGLGCTTWPSCEDDRLVAEWSLHPMIEQLNRFFTGLVSIAVALAVLGALKRRPYSARLTRWAWGLVAGVAAQIVWGGVTVLTHLNPFVVAGHFLISSVLVWNATVLAFFADATARTGDDSSRPDEALEGAEDTPPRATFRQAPNLLVGLCAAFVAVLLTGPLVTGSGPHGGDVDAPRLSYDISSVARLHSLTVWVFVALAVFATLRWRREPARVLLVATVAQGGVGYLQYFTEVPPFLVALHVLGATLVTSALTWFALDVLYPPPAEVGDQETAPPVAVPAESGAQR